MITAIIIISLAFTYTAFETHWFTIRLLVGMDKPRSAGRIMAEWDIYNKVHAKEIEQEQAEREKERTERIKHICNICNKHNDNLLVETKTIVVGNSICHVTGCPDCIAKYTKDIENSQKIKEHSFKPCQVPLFITQERTGSRNEWTRWNNETNEMEYSAKYKKGYHHQIVTEYATEYHDCLCGKEWLKEHEHFEYPEATIELSIDGKSLSVNGNYKKGMIGDFMSQYTEKVRAGKRTLTIVKGGHVADLGGGAYIAVNGEVKDGEYKYF